MSTFALVVGIDGYKRRPLNRAVGDAEEFRDAILRHGLVEPRDATLLCSDAKGERILPTRRNILGALRPLFSPTPAFNRMFFYFAGHGVLTFADAARTITTTALATLDVEDFDADGDGYIDFRALVDAFRTTGPAEQFYFVDGCRNVAWKRHPAINPGLGFQEQAPGPSRGQEILYAVSHLGEALEDKTNGGVFTQHLLEGLDGAGLGLRYDADLDAGLVTASSLIEHLQHRVSQALKEVPLWKHKYQLPALDHHDPRPAPLRSIPAPALRFTVHIEPEGAAPATVVTLGSGRQVFQGVGWPPTGNHQSVSLAPMMVRLMAESTAGPTDPHRRSVDVRIESEVTVRVSSPPPPPGRVGSSAEPAPAQIAIAASNTTTVSEMVTVVATANEPTVTTKLTRLDAVDVPVEKEGALEQTVAPGAYRIEFLHGLEVVCRGEFVATAGEQVSVQSVMQRLEALGTGRTDPANLPRGKVVSESVGLMQAGVLETTLALIGFKPFDRDQLVAGQLAGVVDWSSLVPPHDPEGPIVCVVVALEGNGWRQAPADLLAATECRLFGSLGGSDRIAFRPLSGNRGAVGLNGDRVGFGAATGLARDVQFPSLLVDHPSIARARLSLCVTDGHITVVTIVARPDGDFQVGQYLLPNPSSQRGQYAPNGAKDLYKARQLSRWVRALHLVQRALVTPAGGLQDHPDVPFYRDILNGDRYDPLLSAEVLSRRPQQLGSGAAEKIIRTTARFQVRSGRSFMDESTLVAHLLSGTMGWAIERAMRMTRPALLSTARLLASAAMEQGVADASVLRALDVSDPDSLFLMERDPPAIATRTPEGTPTTNQSENERENGGTMTA